MRQCLPDKLLPDCQSRPSSESPTLSIIYISAKLIKSYWAILRKYVNSDYILIRWWWSVYINYIRICCIRNMYNKLTIGYWNNLPNQDRLTIIYKFFLSFNYCNLIHITETYINLTSVEQIYSHHAQSEYLNCVTAWYTSNSWIRHQTNWKNWPLKSIKGFRRGPRQSIWYRSKWHQLRLTTIACFQISRFQVDTRSLFNKYTHTTQLC